MEDKNATLYEVLNKTCYDLKDEFLIGYFDNEGCYHKDVLVTGFELENRIIEDEDVICSCEMFINEEGETETLFIMDTCFSDWWKITLQIEFLQSDLDFYKKDKDYYHISKIYKQIDILKKLQDEAEERIIAKW